MNKESGQVPLERALSKLGVASRRETREWVQAGRLKVNGAVVRDPWHAVVPERDVFELDSRLLKRVCSRTVVFYKPRGVAAVKADAKGRPTVFEKLPTDMQGLHPVGVLEPSASGLMLLTSDTQLFNFLTNPANRVSRKYVVTVEGEVVAAEVEQMLNGIEDDGELLKPATIMVLKAGGRESHLLVELTGEKNREIRRLFNVFDHRLRKLKRISFGHLELADLEPGKYREVAASELAAWKHA